MSAAVGGSLYLFAGFYNSGIDVEQSAFKYDVAADAWSRLNDVPIAETHVGTTTDGTTVYFAGGFRNDWFGDADAEFWMYSPTADTWTQGPSLPGARGAGALVLIGRTLHFYGGLMADGKTDSGDHWALNLDDIDAGWTERADLPNPRNHFGYAAMDGKAYAIGGQHALDEADGLDAAVHMYDPAADAWTQVASLPVARSHQHNTTIVDGDRLITIGGTDPGNVATDEVLEYKPATDEWKLVGRLPVARSAAVAAMVGQDVVVSTGTPTGVLPQVDTWSAPVGTLVDDDAPDLMAAVETRGATALVSGDKGKAVVRVENGGIERFKGDATIELRLSTDAVFSDDDVVLGVKEKSLRIGQDKRKSTRIKFETPVAADGSYYLLARVAPTDPTSEATASNNAAAADNLLEIRPAFVDLVGTSATTQTEPLTPGDDFKTKVEVLNVGNQKFSGNVAFDVVARPDGAVDDTLDIPLTTVAVERNIGVEKSKTFKLKKRIPDAAVPGAYQLLVTLTDATAETNTANNLLASDDLILIERADELQ